MVEKFEVGKYYKAVKNTSCMSDSTYEKLQKPRKLLGYDRTYDNILSCAVFEGVDVGSLSYYCIDFAFVKNGKTIKEKPDNMERYLVFGTGCNNKSEFYRTEKDAKEYLKTIVKDSSWTGRNILYKLIPILEGETSIKVTKFKKAKIK